MIFRRLAEALREQNWFTVILEVLIVIVGIFVGLQVDDWNQARRDILRSQQAIEELRVEFAEIGEAERDLANYYKGVIEDLQTVIRTLDAGEVRPGDEAAIKDAIAFADVFADPPPPSGTFRDLASSGNLGLIRDKNLRLRLIEYDQGLDIIVDGDAAVHNTMGHFIYALRRHSKMEQNFRFPDSQNLAFVDVRFPGTASVDYEAILVDADFRVAVEQFLRGQISRYANIKVSQSKVAQIQELIDQNLEIQTPPQAN